MKIERQMIHKFTGEPTVNGNTYSKDCIVAGVENDIDITIGFDENKKVGIANNFYLENNTLYADLELCESIEIINRSYVVPQFELLEPLYDENKAQEEFFKQPIQKVKVLSLGCVTNPEIKNLDRVHIKKEGVI